MPRLSRKKNYFRKSKRTMRKSKRTMRKSLRGGERGYTVRKGIGKGRKGKGTKGRRGREGRRSNDKEKAARVELLDMTQRDTDKRRSKRYLKELKHRELLQNLFTKNLGSKYPATTTLRQWPQVKQHFNQTQLKPILTKSGKGKTPFLIKI